MEWVVKLLERVGDFVERPVNILEEVRYFAGGGVNPGRGTAISDGKGLVIPVRGIVIIVRASFDSAQEDTQSAQEDARSPRMTVSFSFSYSYSFSISCSYSFFFLLSL